MFTPSEVEILKRSPYVKNITPSQIIYGEVFDREYLRLIHEGHSPVTCFELLGLDVGIIGKGRIKAYHTRYLKDVRTGALLTPDDPSYQTVSEEIENMRAENEIMRQENEFLKKKRQLDMKMQNQLGSHLDIMRSLRKS